MPVPAPTIVLPEASRVPSNTAQALARIILPVIQQQTRGFDVNRDTIDIDVIIARKIYRPTIIPEQRLLEEVLSQLLDEHTSGPCSFSVADVKCVDWEQLVDLLDKLLEDDIEGPAVDMIISCRPSFDEPEYGKLAEHLADLVGTDVLLTRFSFNVCICGTVYFLKKWWTGKIILVVDSVKNHRVLSVAEKTTAIAVVIFALYAVFVYGIYHSIWTILKDCFPIFIGLGIIVVYAVLVFFMYQWFWTTSLL